jgi:hypothetical protein
MESFLIWLGWGELAIPVRSQLSQLIFEKAIRRRDVKEAGSSGPKLTDESGKPKKVKQGAVNLVGVDAKRVSDCWFVPHDMNWAKWQTSRANRPLRSKARPPTIFPVLLSSSRCLSSF